ncbi:MAG TPA: hypothetical protein VMD91_02540 [Candidatus Sulfotelmatobacter sp.]|nr:hypothetical protein [Candidatus Sulfotelmatobacter sp.]
MNGSAGAQSTLITLVIVVLVVYRFSVRELKDRVVRARGLWGRPGILALFTIALCYGALQAPNPHPLTLTVELVVGVLVGLVVGAFVVYFTTFQPAPRAVYPAVRAQGSWKTIVVWVVAIALRFAVRFAMHGESAADEYTLNAALVALMAAAFGVVAVSFQRAIGRYPPVG